MASEGDCNCGRAAITGAIETASLREALAPGRLFRAAGGGRSRRRRCKEGATMNVITLRTSRTSPTAHGGGLMIFSVIQGHQPLPQNTGVGRYSRMRNAASWDGEIVPSVGQLGTYLPTRGAKFHYHATGMPVFFSLPAVVSGIKLEVAGSVPVVVNSVDSANNVNAGKIAGSKQRSGGRC